MVAVRGFHKFAVKDGLAKVDPSAGVRPPTPAKRLPKAISLGDDTDTTAAVAGGFAGVRHGLSGVPQRWLLALAERTLADPLVASLLERWRVAT